jgi:hypothetical protein
MVKTEFIKELDLIRDTIEDELGILLNSRKRTRIIVFGRSIFMYYVSYHVRPLYNSTCVLNYSVIANKYCGYILDSNSYVTQREKFLERFEYDKEFKQIAIRVLLRLSALKNRELYDIYTSLQNQMERVKELIKLTDNNLWNSLP